MQNLFTRQSGQQELVLAPGQAHAMRPARAARVKVGRGLVWLTLEEGGADIWLHAGQGFELPAGGLAVLEAGKEGACVELQASPGAGIASIVRLLPQGLLRWG